MASGSGGSWEKANQNADNGVDMSTDDDKSPQTTPQAPNASARDYSAWRFPMSFATALLVTATAWLVAWGNCSNRELVVYNPQFQTWRWLKQVCDNVDRYRQERGKLPESLAVLDIDENQHLLINENKQPLDDWGHPFRYQVEGDNYVIISYGQDGEPGGKGYDADLRSDQEPEFVTMSLWEFTTSSHTWGMKICCVLAGLFTLPICLMQSRQPRSRGTLIRVVAMYMITAFFAVVIANLMSALHLPTGH
jgi:Type II secretion system (T2SS), protein G